MKHGLPGLPSCNQIGYRAGRQVADDGDRIGCGSVKARPNRTRRQDGAGEAAGFRTVTQDGEGITGRRDESFVQVGAHCSGQSHGPGKADLAIIVAAVQTEIRRPAGEIAAVIQRDDARLGVEIAGVVEEHAVEAEYGLAGASRLAESAGIVEHDAVAAVTPIHA